MRIHVVWPDGAESEVDMPSLRDLDEFLGDALRSGSTVDMRCAGEDALELVLRRPSGAQA